jgi:hypothetical protein
MTRIFSIEPALTLKRWEFRGLRGWRVSLCTRLTDFPIVCYMLTAVDFGTRISDGGKRATERQRNVRSSKKSAYAYHGAADPERGSPQPSFMPNTRWRITTIVKNPKNALNNNNAAWRHRGACSSFGRNFRFTYHTCTP